MRVGAVLASLILATSPDAYQAALEAKATVERRIASGMLPCDSAMSTLCADAVPERRILEPSLAAFVEAVDRLVAVEPESERTGELDFRAAVVELLYGDVFDAKRRLRRIGETYVGRDVGREATWMLIESELIGLGERGETWNAEGRARFDDHARACEAYRDWKQRVAIGGQYGPCRVREAEDYLGFASAGSEFLDKALFNAAVAYERARCFGSAVWVYERLVHETPKSALADQARFRIGVVYEKMWALEEAALAYADLVHRGGNDPRRKDALFNLAVTRSNLGRHAESAASFLEYAREYPNEPDALEMIFRAAREFEAAGAKNNLVDTLTRYVALEARWPHDVGRLLEAYGLLLRAHRNKGDLDAMRAVADRCMQTFTLWSTFHAAPESKLAAECAFEAAEGEASDPHASLDRIEAAFREVLRLLDADKKVAAYTRIGEVLERGGREDRAKEAFQRALASADSMGVTGPYRDRAEQGLRRLDPDGIFPPHAGKSLYVPAQLFPRGLDATGDGPIATHRAVVLGPEGCRIEP